ncbi:MFS transporter [Aestuariimicrobium ganziense]|uniref:MFS transporter n=1 Tax=Aestuariimicrobium ganziense TaxID=2773677 RepID=UPI001940EEB7|nr:MFS transporter [Aestuariimicrobium ganziense]
MTAGVVAEQGRLTLRQRARVAAPLPAMWMSSVIIHNVYVKFYTDVLGLGADKVGWVYFWFNLWNVLNDPVFGVLLDKMRHKPGRGKFVPVMRRTVPFMVLGLVAMAWSQPDWSQNTLFLVFLAELFIFDVAATFYLISATSWFYLVAPTRQDRVDVEVVRTWIGNAISFLATVVATQLLVGDLVNDHTVMALLLTGVVAVNAAVYAIAVWRLPDPDHLYEHGDNGGTISRAELKQDVLSIVRMRAFWAWFGYQLLAMAPMGIYFTGFLYFMDHVIRAQGWQATVADSGSMLIVLAVLPLLARVVKRLGGRTSIWVGSVPYMLGFAALFFASTWWVVLGCYVAIMAGRHVMSMAGVALDACLVDDNERQSGTRKTGLFASIRALLSAPLSGVQLVLYMAILSRFGFVEGGGLQGETAQLGIRVATALVPIAFCLVGLVPLLFLPYGRRLEEELSQWSRGRREGGLETPVRPASGVAG